MSQQFVWLLIQAGIMLLGKRYALRNTWRLAYWCDNHFHSVGYRYHRISLLLASARSSPWAIVYNLKKEESMLVYSHLFCPFNRRSIHYASASWLVSIFLVIFLIFLHEDQQLSFLQPSAYSCRHLTLLSMFFKDFFLCFQKILRSPWAADFLVGGDYKFP